MLDVRRAEKVSDVFKNCVFIVEGAHVVRLGRMGGEGWAGYPKPSGGLSERGNTPFIRVTEFYGTPSTEKMIDTSAGRNVRRERFAREAV